jgi:glucokinase
MENFSLIVLDLGGTKLNIGRYRDGKIEESVIYPFDNSMTVYNSIDFLGDCIGNIILEDTSGIAIGVPSIVNVPQGIVSNAINIQSWQEVPLKALLEQRFALPVYVNNDVNCFTKGEHFSGCGKRYQNMVGLCLGTGLGAGLILQNKLYVGANCCAGEVGGVNYLDGHLDDYCSGSFFHKHYQQCGSKLAIQARNGEKHALLAFEQFAEHLAFAIKHLLLMVDPQLIVIGGSVSQSFDLFIEKTWKNLADFPYPNVISNLKIKKSQQQHSALLGAAHLYLESKESM